LPEEIVAEVNFAELTPIRKIKFHNEIIFGIIDQSTNIHSTKFEKKAVYPQELIPQNTHFLVPSSTKK